VIRRDIESVYIFGHVVILKKTLFVPHPVILHAFVIPVLLLCVLIESHIKPQMGANCCCCRNRLQDEGNDLELGSADVGSSLLGKNTVQQLTFQHDVDIAVTKVRFNDRSIAGSGVMITEQPHLSPSTSYEVVTTIRAHSMIGLPVSKNNQWPSERAMRVFANAVGAMALTKAAQEQKCNGVISVELTWKYDRNEEGHRCINLKILGTLIRIHKPTIVSDLNCLASTPVANISCAPSSSDIHSEGGCHPEGARSVV